MRLQCAIFAMLLLMSQAAQAASPKDIIASMIQNLRGHANIAQYEMTITRPSWTRVFKVRVWDERQRHRVFVRILEPPKEAGISFLRLDYNLWNYLPSVEKVMKIPPSMMLQPWMGSDFTNDDLVKESSYIDDYTHAQTGDEVRDGQKVLKIELQPLPKAPVVWGKVIFWVREKDNLPVEQHFLDEHGRLIKDLKFGDFRVADGEMMPHVWEMTNVAKPGQKTLLKLLSIDFDPSPPIPETVFTERNLRP